MMRAATRALAAGLALLAGGPARAASEPQALAAMAFARQAPAAALGLLLGGAEPTRMLALSALAAGPGRAAPGRPIDPVPSVGSAEPVATHGGQATGAASPGLEPPLPEPEAARPLPVTPEPKLALAGPVSLPEGLVLTRPLAGRVVRRFGEPGPGGSTSGIAFSARPGASVVAPASGVVAFAGSVRGSRGLLILEVAAGTHLVLGGLEWLSVGSGDHVAAGQVVGGMAEAPGSKAAAARQAGTPPRAAEPRNEPRSASRSGHLTLEVRVAGEPVDPLRLPGLDLAAER